MPRNLLISIAIFLLSAFSTHTAASTDAPCRFEDGMIWLKVSTAQDRSLNFLLDTGASATVIDLQAAHRLGLALGPAQAVQGVHTQGTAYPVRGFSASVAGLPLPRNILALDLSRVSAGCHHSIDGLIGADFLHDHDIEVDTAIDRVRLLEPAEIQTSGCEILYVSIRNGAPCVRASVGKAPADWMRVDTGCNSAAEWVASSKLAQKAAGASIGLATASRQTVETSIQLGAQEISGMKVGLHTQPIFAGESGLLGTGVLSRFKVTLDLRGHRLLLAKR